MIPPSSPFSLQKLTVFKIRRLANFKLAMYYRILNLCFLIVWLGSGGHTKWQRISSIMDTYIIERIRPIF